MVKNDLREQVVFQLQVGSGKFRDLRSAIIYNKTDPNFYPLYIAFILKIKY